MKYIVKAHINEQLAKDYLKRHEGISSTLWKKSNVKTIFG